MERDFNIHNWQAKFLKEESSNTKTAIKWLESKFDEFETIYDSLPAGLYEYVNQAKEMEKQQIEDAYEKVFQMEKAEDTQKSTITTNSDKKQLTHPIKMNDFDLKKFLVENKLTTNSQEIEENRLRNLVGAAAMAAASLGSPNAQAQDAPNGTPQKTWQQMSAGEKGAKKAELVKKGGFERFRQYKDSISNDATTRLDADFEKNAAKRGMTADQYREFLSQNAKQPDAGLDGMMGPDFSHGKCGISKAGAAQNKKDWKSK